MSSEYQPLRSWHFGALSVTETDIPNKVEVIIHYEKTTEHKESDAVRLCALLTKEQFKALAKLGEYQSMYSDHVRYAKEPEAEQETPE